MKVRNLRVTDIRCRAEGCGAGPGECCISPASFPGSQFVGYQFAGVSMWIHRSRMDEYDELRDAGWEWQEVDPRDAGAQKGE